MLCVVAFALMGSLMGSGSPPVQQAGGVTQAENAPVELTLTDRHTEGSFPIPREVISAPPPVLKLIVTKVVNPDRTAFQIFIYLSAGTAPGKETEGVRIPVGNVGLFPADQPGAFLLRDSGAFEKWKASVSHPKQGEPRLLLEIRPLHPAKPWTRVEVTFATPQWTAEPRK